MCAAAHFYERERVFFIYGCSHIRPHWIIMSYMYLSYHGSAAETSTLLGRQRQAKMEGAQA